MRTPTNSPMTLVLVTAVVILTASGPAHGHTSSKGETWQPVSDMPTPRRSLALVAGSDGGIYAIGGFAAGYQVSARNERFDERSGTWTSLPPAPSPLALLDGGRIGRHIYLPGGWDGSSFTAGVLVLDTGDGTWSSAASAPRIVAAYAVAVCGERLYRSGGAEAATWPMGTAGAEVYNPGTGIWTSLPPMLSSRASHASGCIDGRLYVAGGIDQVNRYSRSAEVYDPALGTWSALPELPQVWAEGGDLVRDARLWLIGGTVAGSTTAGVLQYDPASQSWLQGPALSVPRTLVEADLGRRGALVAGGWGTGLLTSAELLAACTDCPALGWLKGTVIDSEPAGSLPSAPCVATTVAVDPAGWQLQVEPANGWFGPLALATGTYSLSVQAPGYTTVTGPGSIEIAAGATSFASFTLERPVLQLVPPGFEVTAAVGTTSTQVLEVRNHGHQPLEVEVLLRQSSDDKATARTGQHAATQSIEVEPELVAAVARQGRAGCLLYLRQRPDLSAAFDMGWRQRGRYVVQRLQETAERSQQRLTAYLQSRDVAFSSYWISNIMVLESVDTETFAALQLAPEVAALRARRHPLRYEPELDGVAAKADGRIIEPNLVHIGADQVWQLGIDGSGMVLGSIDTGAHYTHEALAGSYRGNLGGGVFEHDHSWWDPYDHDTVPNDASGHGSHTIGIMLGDNGQDSRIGMAPGATWIACQGFDPGGTDAGLLECAQFMLAPWDLGGADPDPDLRAHVVNSSWGICASALDGWFSRAVESWLAAGVYPVFALGNHDRCGYPQPPGCNTGDNPARYGNVTGVGSTGLADGRYATHSCWGPTDDADTVNPRGYPNLKPQVVAPGVVVRSAFRLADDLYVRMSGTSMSAPHVSGLVALLWQAAPCLLGDYAATETLIEHTARSLPYASDCGGEGPGDYPNQATGWGEIDAAAAVRAALASCTAPWLEIVPESGLVTSPLQIMLRFSCTQPGEHRGTLHVFSNDPCAAQRSLPVVLTCGQPPANDECAAATVITSSPFSQTLSTGPATLAPGDPVSSCDDGPGGSSVWYTFTPVSDGSVSLSTCGSSYDTVLTLWQGACGSLSEVACNDDAASCAPQSQLIDVAVVGGVPYTLGVSSREPGGGALQLQLQATVPVPVELSGFTLE